MTLRSITRYEGPSTPACGQVAPFGGPPCTLPAGHTGEHMACDDDGNELEAWRD